MLCIAPTNSVSKDGFMCFLMQDIGVMNIMNEIGELGDVLLLGSGQVP
jgi:hypothetical protein